MRIGALKLKTQIFCDDVPAFGPGKADLLDAIAREGSIAGAGRALGMSYRRSWMLVDEMNRCFNEKLVETLAGGGRVRGARLTSAGSAILAAFRELEAATAHVAESAAYRTVAGMMLDRPRPPKRNPVLPQP